jgi:hypothetical protein
MRQPKQLVGVFGFEDEKRASELHASRLIDLLWIFPGDFVTEARQSIADMVKNKKQRQILVVHPDAAHRVEDLICNLPSNIILVRNAAPFTDKGVHLPT